MKKTYAIFVTLLFLSACGSNPNESNSPVPTSVTVVSTIDAPISESDRLNVCMVGEPNSIYLYDPLNVTAQKSLAIVYDGILTAQPRMFKASILDDLPTFENDSARVVPIEVRQGDKVVTVDQIVKNLAPGDLVLPSGCQDINCSIIFNGEPLLMDQVVVDLKFLPDLRWSDGEPLTAADSIFSYMLAKSAVAPAIRDLIARTQSYELVSDDVIQWWGAPGYMSVEPSSVFFTPFPTHLRDSEDTSDLAKNAMNDSYLVGWGAYKFVRWVNGEMIFSPNPFFFDPDGKQAQFKEMVIKYLPTTDSVYDAFFEGACDVVDSASGFEKFTPILVDLNLKGQINMQIAQVPLIETLIYNTRADHKGGTPGINPLADPLTRAGINNCIERYALVNYDLRGYPVITDSLVAPYNLPNTNDWSPFTRSVTESKEYFERAGWSDDDHDPATPRIAKNIIGVKNGTKLILNFAVMNTPLRVAMAETITNMLSDCGVGVETNIVEPEAYFETSANGTLPSGLFDIAQFAFGSYEIDPACQVFVSNNIPSIDTGYQGVNFSGYTNYDYDMACANAKLSQVDSTARVARLRSAHEILLLDGPALPLFHQYQVRTAQADICLPELDPNDRLGYVNIVQVTRGADCRATP